MVVFTKKMPEKCVQDRLNANTVTLEHVWNVLIALFFCRLFPFVIGGFTEMGKQTQLTQKACRAHACGQRHLIKYCKAISHPEALNLRMMLENYCLARHNSAEFSTLQPSL